MHYEWHDFCCRASGIEGRPTSPSSVDGRENLDEENEGSRPVTGIGTTIN